MSRQLRKFTREDGSYVSLDIMNGDLDDPRKPFVLFQVTADYSVQESKAYANKAEAIDAYMSLRRQNLKLKG